jgi:cytochrome b subunit of formate dehydrogenase
VRKEKIMRFILIIAAIVLLVVGILGLFPQFAWAHTQLWRSILEIVVGGLVLLVGVRRN